MENRELDLVEKLKDAPNGTELWTPICGKCFLKEAVDKPWKFPITVIVKNTGEEDIELSFRRDGGFTENSEAECLLFPSKENRDWSTFKVEKKPIIERIKTFNDALKELGSDHPYVKAYQGIKDIIDYEKNRDAVAYLKLRIIAAALNEGWQPQFTNNEVRYYPWFSFLTKDEYENVGGEEKKRKYGKHRVLRSGSSNSSYGFVNVFAYYGSASSNSNFGARLAFKTRELAEYAGEQFFDIWVDYLFK